MPRDESRFHKQSWQSPTKACLLLAPTDGQPVPRGSQDLSQCSFPLVCICEGVWLADHPLLCPREGPVSHPVQQGPLPQQRRGGAHDTHDPSFRDPLSSRSLSILSALFACYLLLISGPPSVILAVPWPSGPLIPVPRNPVLHARPAALLPVLTSPGLHHLPPTSHLHPCRPAQHIEPNNALIPVGTSLHGLGHLFSTPMPCLPSSPS